MSHPGKGYKRRPHYLQRSCFQLLSKANLIPPEMTNQFSQLFSFYILVFQVLTSFHTICIEYQSKEIWILNWTLFHQSISLNENYKYQNTSSLKKNFSATFPFKFIWQTKLRQYYAFCPYLVLGSENNHLNCFCLISVETQRLINHLLIVPYQTLPSPDSHS